MGTMPEVNIFCAVNRHIRKFRGVGPIYRLFVSRELRESIKQLCTSLDLASEDRSDE